MNDLLKFTIIITIVVLTAFVLLQCVQILSDNIKVLRKLLQHVVEGGNYDDKCADVPSKSRSKKT